MGLFPGNTTTSDATAAVATSLLPKLSPTVGHAATHESHNDNHNNIQFNNTLATSPSFLSEQEPTLSPLSRSDTVPMSFVFDINALNQFLTSGDLDTFMQPPLITPGSEQFAPVRQYAYPKAPDTIKPAWFTNMDEKDLARESEMQRSEPFTSAAGAIMESLPSEMEMDSGTIDETWREKVSNDMVPQIFNIVGPLPSIEFLV